MATVSPCILSKLVRVLTRHKITAAVALKAKDILFSNKQQVSGEATAHTAGTCTEGGHDQRRSDT